MQNLENIEVTGELYIEVRNEFNEIIDTRYVPNLVVTTGRNWIIGRMTGTPPVLMSHMAIGSNDTAPVVGQTTLLNQLARVALSSTNSTGNTITYTALFDAGVGTGSLVEAGIFNDPTAGTMLARTTFGVLTKAAGDVVTITWTITIN